MMIRFFNKILSVVIILFILQYSTLSTAQYIDYTRPDTTIGLGTFNGFIQETLEQPDGKLLVCGNFSYYKSYACSKLLRLNADGTLDTTFHLGAGFTGGPVLGIALQSDGKIIAVGSFFTCNGLARKGIVRLNSNGSVDETFNVGIGLNGYAKDVALDQNSNVVVGGNFSMYNNIVVNNLVRLLSNGSIDNTFNIGVGVQGGGVNSLNILSNSNIAIGGGFSTMNNVSTQGGFVVLNSIGQIQSNFYIGITASVVQIEEQSNGQLLLLGDFTSYQGVSRNNIARLNADGSLDLVFDIGSGFASALTTLRTIKLQPDDKLIVAGVFTAYQSLNRVSLIRFNTNGTEDPSFQYSNVQYDCIGITVLANKEIVVNGGSDYYNNFIYPRLFKLTESGHLIQNFNRANIGAQNGGVHCIYENKEAGMNQHFIYVAGTFTGFNGYKSYSMLNNYSKWNLVRMNDNGELDTSYTTNFTVGPIKCMKSYLIDKLIVGGTGMRYTGEPDSYIYLLNYDGSVDHSFSIGSGFNGAVFGIEVIDNDRIVVVGAFTSYNGINANYIICLNKDGSINSNFKIGQGANSYITSIIKQPDGQIIIGGNFSSYDEHEAIRVARLNTDGSYDTTFNVKGYIAGIVNTLALHSDGRVVIGGVFNQINGLTINHIARLNIDGTYDYSFKSNSGFDAGVSKIQIDHQDKIWVAGSFTTYNGVASPTICGILPNGNIDNTIIMGGGLKYYTSTAQINAMQLSRNGRLYIGGNFDSYNSIICSNIISFRVASIVNNRNYNSISGVLYTEKNKNCVYEAFENPISKRILKANPSNYYTYTNQNGQYKMYIDTGSVDLNLQLILNDIDKQMLVDQCGAIKNIKLTGVGKDTCCINFADSIKQCAMLAIDVVKSRARRCFRGYSIVNYNNFGSQDADNAVVQVVMPKDFIPISATPMWTSRVDSLLTFNVGKVEKGKSYTIQLNDSVRCGNEAIRGQIQCIKARISPSTNCSNPSPAWDKSSMVVSGVCNQGYAKFIILNHGSGDMSSSHPYRLYVNDTLVYNGTFQLKSGQQLEVKYPVGKTTIRIEADQHPLHPGKSRPRATVQNCGSVVASNADFKITAPLDNQNMIIDEECARIVDSYDPNDKKALPIGMGTTHQIEAGEEIEYTIRFQNTGSDTAYTVRVVDTLDVNIDPASFKEGVASHAYTLSISGKDRPVLTFLFSKINLPDSTTNQLASNGFVSYKVKSYNQTTNGTLIKNFASIYFDYNSPIITNETFHTIGDIIPTDLARGADVIEIGVTTSSVNTLNNAEFKVYPNPVINELNLDLPYELETGTFKLVSMQGVDVYKTNIVAAQQQVIPLKGIQTGMYIYQILEHNQVKSSGLLQVR